jgi:DNA-binding HxlR family transcriptional regulator
MKECNSNNPVNLTLKVIGGKWKPLILWYVHQQTLRFNELKKHMVGVTQKMLTQELKQMEKDGLIKRKVYPVIPPKVEYSITAYGSTLFPILKAMDLWGQKHAKRK